MCFGSSGSISGALDHKLHNSGLGQDSDKDESILGRCGSIFERAIPHFWKGGSVFLRNTLGPGSKFTTRGSASGVAIGDS